MRSTLDWDDVFISAALEPHRWVASLAQIAGHTGSSHGQILGFGGARENSFTIANDLPTNIMDSFHAINGASPAQNYRIAACNRGLAQGNYDGILHEAHYDAELPTLQSNDYIAWCEEFDIPFGCQTNLIVDRVGMVGLALLRKRGEGRTTAQQRRMFSKASMAARRAVRLQERLEGEQARLLAGAFDAIRVTAFVLDTFGQLQAMTKSAEMLVADCTIALHCKSLSARGTPIALEQGIAALVAEDGLDYMRLRIDSVDKRPPLFIEGFRLPQREYTLGRLPRAILLAKSPKGDRAGVSAFLSALYQLTVAETDIATRLYTGASRDDIAQTRQVTGETLRGQIKAICAKTGAGNEADLMRLMAALLA